jgi:NAD(P)-dependent dehydrogenase (short-subunit alcohol dehydrogenase family)
MTGATTPVSGQREPELAGQTVMVIGGSSGIGLETARRARTEAADVIIVGRNPDRLKKAAAEAAAEAGVDVTVEIGEGLPHVYLYQLLLGTPEAAEATGQIGKFLRARVR